MAIQARVTGAIRNEMQHHAEVLLQEAYRLIHEVHKSLLNEVAGTDEARSSLMARSRRCEELQDLLNPVRD